MKRYTLLFALMATLLLTSCWYNRKWDELHPTPAAAAVCNDTVGVTMSYSVHIAPLIQTNCSTNLVGCHKAGLSLGGDLTTYSAVAGMVTMSPNNLLCDIQHTCNPMPKGQSKLPDCEIAKVAKWIANGYPNN